MNTPKTHLFKLFFSIEKEEFWLTEMSNRGWHLKKAPGLFYTFEKGSPEERIYKIDFHTIKNEQDFSDYLALFEDSGWRPVDARLSRQNVYWCAVDDGSHRDIFSDSLSVAQRNMRFAKYSAGALLVSLIPYLVLYLNGNLRFTNLGYLTPGLWEMNGPEFWTHFWFETPFVLMRTFFGFVPLILTLAMIYYYLHAYFVYRKAAQSQES